MLTMYHNCVFEDEPISLHSRSVRLIGSRKTQLAKSHKMNCFQKLRFHTDLFEIPNCIHFRFTLFAQIFGSGSCWSGQSYHSPRYFLNIPMLFWSILRLANCGPERIAWKLQPSYTCTHSWVPTVKCIVCLSAGWRKLVKYFDGMTALPDSKYFWYNSEIVEVM